MRSLWVIAWNTFEEARHNKVLHIAAGFAAIIILFSFFMGQVSINQNEKVVKDVGMATISIFGVFVAIFLGVNSLYKELQQRTIYVIVSKPINRSGILLGKFFGMVLVLSSVVCLMTAYLYMVIFFMESKIDTKILPAIVLIMVELYIVAAAGILFSSFSTPFLSGFFTFGFFVVGRISYELGQFGERSKNAVFKFVATGIQKVFDLESFNLRSAVVHGFPVYHEDFWYPILYAFFLVTVLIGFSIFAFRRRDFK